MSLRRFLSSMALNYSFRRRVALGERQVARPLLHGLAAGIVRILHLALAERVVVAFLSVAVEELNVILVLGEVEGRGRVRERPSAEAAG